MLKLSECKSLQATCLLSFQYKLIQMTETAAEFSFLKLTGKKKNCSNILHKW